MRGYFSKGVKNVEVDILPRIQKLAVGGMAGISAVLSLHAFTSALKWRPDIYETTAIAFLLATVTGLHILHCSRALCSASNSPPTISFFLQSLLTLSPLPLVHGEWAGISGLLAGAFLITLDGRTAWALAGALSTLQACATFLTSAEAGAALFSLTITGLTGLTFFCVTRLAQLAERLQAARGEDAQLAVINERHRFARDLHDLVGYSLSTAATKSELAYRLAERSPDSARAELSQVIQVIRNTHSEMRKVAHDYHHLSLDNEIESARSVLEAAGIEPRFSSLGVDFAHRSSSVLAAVLREGTSNVLKHSTARYCVVRLFRRDDSVRLVIINDGPTPKRETGGTLHGVGLRSLSERILALGGRLHVSRGGIAGHEEFRLEAMVPDTPAGLIRNVIRGRGSVWGESRLIPWMASDPALRHRDPDGVDSVSGP
ncbi:histidine kinase [Streptomyces sp. MRC013]|uniref:sensor histidine kinase n=1 Tax=Streptomyces sp. MRC013 TaxID=2898276 RepID=UPI0020267191|nr:histidine kinase [Streptomyces sp. MRC013]URM89879.1 histidine kinase [Streptomyces sp. MRC013]